MATSLEILYLNARQLAPLFGLFTSFAFIIGCCIGSFMNVVVWRLPRGEKLSYPPSHCPKCGHAIPPWENIPIISWLCLKARCSSCHQPISIKYPLGEAATGILFTLLWFAIYCRSLNLSLLPPYFYLAATMLAVALIDAEHGFIPNKLTYSGTIFALIWTLLFPAGRIIGLYSEIPHSGHLLTRGFMTLLSQLGYNISSPRSIAIIDCLLGAAFGFAIIFLFSQILNLLIPGEKILFKKPTAIKISREGIEWLGEKKSWSELLPAPTLDSAVIHGNLKGSKQIVKVTANANGCTIDGALYNEGKILHLTALHITTPREAMGMGDIKLMIMTGAFLGADASIYILFAASILALLAAGAISIIRRRRIYAMPFAPSIALATYLWMLFGNIM